MTRKPRVLAAEDDPVSGQFLKNVLRLRGIDADLAHDGKEAVEMWEKGDYDLILMDVQMPELDGLAATRLIREKEETSGGHVPIVAMTGHSDRQDACREAGMDDCLSKPVDIANATFLNDLMKK